MAPARRHIIRSVFEIFRGLCLLGLSCGSAGAVQGIAGDGHATNFAPNPIIALHPSELTGAIRIDGVLDSAWVSTEHMDNFCEVWPSENTQPKARTEGYVTFDKDDLYLAFVCYDPDMHKLRASLTDRDHIFQDDFVGIMLDTYRNEQAAYELFVNPYGIQGDLIRSIDGNEDASFDAVWESAARIYEDRWVVEIRMPFKSLRFPAGPQQNWAVHFFRIYPRESRFQLSWMPISQNNNSLFAQAGRLEIPRSATSGGSTVELLPYTIASADKALAEDDNGNGYRQGTRANAAAGFNLKYGVASNLVLDVAYNPDFSQIEADASQLSVNNTFALFYTEKRPFFLEGGDIFSVDRNLNLLYTRSINDPLVAGKLTGKFGRMTLGCISTVDESTPYILPFEEQSTVVATKKNSVTNIARVKYDLGSRSYVGFAASDRRLTGQGGANTAGALDANIRLNEQYAVTALMAVSRTQEPVDSALSADDIDALTFRSGGRTHTSAFDGESFNGWSLRTAFERSSRHWNFYTFYQEISPAFRAENSFITGNDQRFIGAWTGYTFRYDKNPILNRVQPELDFWRKYNFDGRVKDYGFRPSLYLGLQKQTGIYMSVFLVNNEYYGGKQFDRIHRAFINVNCDAWRTVGFGFYVEGGRFINRLGTEGDVYNPFITAKGLDLEFWGTLRPTAQLSDQISFTSFTLRPHFGGPTIRSQRIVRNTLSYQFTRRLFLRLIGEINATDEVYTDTDDDGNFLFDAQGRPIRVREKGVSLSLDPLLSYKINPFTVFFLGAHIGGEKDPYPNYEGLTTTSQNVFVKFQYFVRS